METNYIKNIDCRIGLAELPNESIDLVCSDVPYRIVHHGTSACGGMLSHHNNANALNGKLFEHNDIEFSEYLPELYRVLKPDTHCYLMINALNLKNLQQAAEDAGFRMQNILAWKKNTCLGGNTQIFIRNKKSGMCYRSNLKDLYRTYTTKNKGDWQIMGDNAKWKDIVDVYNNGKQEGVIITFRNGIKIFATHDHKFVTKQGLKQVSELKVGDVVERSKQFETTESKSKIDYELGFFVGLFLAEGSFDKGSLVFTLNRDRKDLGESVLAMSQRYNAKCNKYESKTKYCDIYRVASYILSGVITEYISGSTAKNKHLKREVFNADISFMQGLYQGYINGDGHEETLKSGNKRIAIGFTYNKELEYDLRLISDIIGVRMHTSVRQSKIGDKKYTCISGHITEYSEMNKKDSGEIIAISKPCRQNVYDVQVSGNHLYSLVGGFITHNCTPNQYYMQQLEFILMLRKGKAKPINDCGMSNCLSVPNIVGTKRHPCLPAGEKVFINDNWMNIEEVKAGDKSGYGEVIATSSHIAEHIVELEVDKNKCRATYNHPFLILRGNEVAWCEASQITTNDYILWRTYEKNELNQQKKDIPDTLEKSVTEEPNLSTPWYGKSILEQCQKGCRYITLTVTNKTMIFPISNLSLPLNTSGYTKVADLSKEYGTNHVNAAVSTNPLQQNIGIIKLDTQVEEYVNHALYKNHSQFVRLSLRKVGNVKHIHEKTKVYNLTIAGTPAFDTLIGVSHNTEKPIALMQVMIEQSTNKGDIVLDPFAGSGSTLVAAKRAERNFIGMEVDKKYYEIANKRLYQEPMQAQLF